MTAIDDARKSLIKSPTTAEHFAYNICMHYVMPFRVQSAIENTMEHLFKQHAVPYHVSARLMEGIFYQQKQSNKVKSQEEE